MVVHQLVIYFKGIKLSIAPKCDVLPLMEAVDDLSPAERIAALEQYAFLSPLTTLKSAQYKFQLLKECETEAYKYRKTKFEYIGILHYYISTIFPDLRYQQNSSNQITVMELSRPQLRGILTYFIKTLKSFNGFNFLKADSGYKEIITNAKTMKYNNVIEFSGDVQYILTHLTKSNNRQTAEAGENMLDEYATYFDPIFQHIGYCCSGKHDGQMSECSICQRRFHDYCENYFPLVDGEQFICRFCKNLNGIDENENTRRISLKDLPHNSTTKAMENNVRLLLIERRIPIERVHIRCIYNDNKYFQVHQQLTRHFGYPSKLRYRKKIFVAFQKVEEYETLLFYLEVHEYDDDTIHCNERYVNIAYIDSVQYFSPNDKELRRSIYYEIIQTYLNFAREMGYLKAYIWIAPPDDLQDYVFNQHKKPYRPPTRASLKKFYNVMLEDARKKKIVFSFSSIEKRRPFCTNNYKIDEIPYFAGDFWYMEFERFYSEYEQRNSRVSFPVQLLKEAKAAMNDPINKDLMLVIDLTSPQQQTKALKSKIRDKEPLIRCDIVSDREEFLLYQRANGFSFKTIQHAHLSTKRLCYLLKECYRNV